MVREASGGPAGGQTFEKFDKQVLKVICLFHRRWQSIWFWFNEYAASFSLSPARAERKEGGNRKVIA
jgi:hypothetical protein